MDHDLGESALRSHIEAVMNLQLETVTVTHNHTSPFIIRFCGRKRTGSELGALVSIEVYPDLISSNWSMKCDYSLKSIQFVFFLATGVSYFEIGGIKLLTLQSLCATNVL